MNIEEAWAYGRQQLSASPTPALDARLLLEHVLQASHTFLIAHGEERLTFGQEATYRQLLERARKGEPVPHITGRAIFYGLEFEVTPAVLIPRPETELLVEAAITWARDHGPLGIVDVGTGSGCIAVTLAHHLPQARLDATDIFSDALAIAQTNAHRHNVEQRIQFYHGHLLEPIVGKTDLIVANLPYVADGEWTMLDDGVKWYEPAGALRGGPDGLDLIRQLLEQATTRLHSGGAIFLEIGWQQGKAARQLAQRSFPNAQVEIKADYAGHDRIVVINQ